MARLYGEDLPTFASLAAATDSLTSYKANTVAAFVRELFPNGEPTLAPSSLRDIEAWYFNSSCPAVGSGGYLVPHALGFYLGEVLCHNAGFCWVVEEFAFRPGSYEIGIKKNLLHLMLTKGRRPALERNARKNSLFREYNRYAP